MKKAAKTFGRVAVLMGGWSAERAISLRSGRAVLDALRGAGVDAFPVDASTPSDMLAALTRETMDCAFIAMHGRGGEDGLIQGVLEMMGVPYTGSRFAAAAVCMDKLTTKRMWRDAGLPTPDFEEIDGGVRAKSLVERLGLPLFVKPTSEGSSIGVSRVDTASGIEAAWRKAGGASARVFAERAVEGGEYAVGFVGERWLEPIKIETPRAFYDYTAKYESHDTRYLCPAGLSDARKGELIEIARRAARTLGASGWGRVDLVDDEEGRFYLLELNVTPGMTEASLVPKAAAEHGMDFETLALTILEGAMNGLEGGEVDDARHA